MSTSNYFAKNFFINILIVVGFTITICLLLKRKITHNDSLFLVDTQEFDADNYLSTSYIPLGETIIENNYEYYYIYNKTIKSEYGIIIISDLWGWNSGKIRAIADYISRAGFQVIIPKLLVPCLEEGTHGDGIPLHYNITANYPKFSKYISSFQWNNNIKLKIKTAISILKQNNVNNFAGIGFDYGSWVITQIMSDIDTSLIVKFGIINYPSIISIQQIMNQNNKNYINNYKINKNLRNNNENNKSIEFINKNSTIQLFSQLKGPLLIITSNNEPNNYRLNGNLYELLHNKYSETQTINEFDSMKHGFILKGDIRNDIIRNSIDKSIKYMIIYLKQNFDLNNLND